jgi:DNA polymerase III delta' subunit
MIATDCMEGQKLAKKILSGILRTGRIATTYLFTGPEGIDIRSAGLQFAKTLNCEKGGCGDCPVCRQIENESHPDVKCVTLLPEKKEILIEQMRDVQSGAFLRPFSARYKIYIIDCADMFSAGAANSLLKILEEPPEHTIFILLTSRPQAVLPTIASRCQRVRFVRTIEKPGNDMIEKGKEAVRYLEFGAQDPWKAASREEGRDTADALLMWYRDVLLAKEGSEAVFFTGMEGKLKEFGRDMSVDQAVGALQRILRAREQVVRYVNSQLAMELLFIELRRANKGILSGGENNG